MDNLPVFMRRRSGFGAADENAREGMLDEPGLSMGSAADTSAGVLEGQLDKPRTLLRPPGIARAAPAGVEPVRAAPSESLAHQQLEAMLRRIHQPDTMKATIRSWTSA